MKKLINIHLIGGAYRNGMKVPGWCHAFIEGEASPRYYSEDHCFDSIVADLKIKGIDVSQFEQTMDRWVKTGGTK